MKRVLPLFLLLAACGGDEPAPEPGTVPDAGPEGPSAALENPSPESAGPATQSVLIPGGAGDAHTITFVEVTKAEGGSFWIAQHETTWPVFNLFFLRPEEEQEVDGITGPSKSVFPVERGYGSDGMPALGMTFQSAQAFCQWLNGKQNEHVFRLPTAEEWVLAAGPAPADWGASAWYSANAEGVPHAVGTKAPNSLGLYDMGGNLAEWVTSSEEDPLALGGSWQQDADALGAAGRQQYDLSWQQRDPQWPKSIWWMSDAGFVGFRLVMD